MIIEAKDRLKKELELALDRGTLKKAVFSRPRSKNELKTVLTVFEKNGEIRVKSESAMRDGKMLQRILTVDEVISFASGDACEQYRQINLIGEGQSLELIISEKGKTRFTGSLEGAKIAKIADGQDKQKRYAITPETDGEFLFELGITDKNGRIHDKKQAKYRQINKFIEQIEAVSDALPDGQLCICDLCCGKSYLTFAVYRYFTHHKGRQVKMYGIDLKKDVIEYCTDGAARRGWDGMTFECGDVSTFTPPEPPDLVISLHACDVATDYALAGAVRSGAKVILSTPCCQHELNFAMKCEALEFVTEYSILKQKIASAMTDGLRARLLEIYGYKVTVCELIDPEETPKNVIIRAVKSGKRRTAGALIEKYNAACELLGTEPTLAKLLPLPKEQPKITK